jgi:hypothetical protein
VDTTPLLPILIQREMLGRDPEQGNGGRHLTMGTSIARLHTAVQKQTKMSMQTT